MSEKDPKIDNFQKRLLLFNWLSVKQVLSSTGENVEDKK